MDKATITHSITTAIIPDGPAAVRANPFSIDRDLNLLVFPGMGGFCFSHFLVAHRFPLSRRELVRLASEDSFHCLLQLLHIIYTFLQMPLLITNDMAAAA